MYPSRRTDERRSGRPQRAVDTQTREGTLVGCTSRSAARLPLLGESSNRMASDDRVDATPSHVTPAGLVVLCPVYRDASSSAALVGHLTRAFAGESLAPRVLLVDDGSPEKLIDELRARHDPGLVDVEVLRLRRNVGHQRAIALGVAYLTARVPCELVLVMDGDGEDRPEDAVTLVRRARQQGATRIVFAGRTRRSESLGFRVGYRCYQLAHLLLTGIRVQVGNFSVVPGSFLPALSTLPALWNHYAAAVYQSRLAFEIVPTARGTRYDGRSKMNFQSLAMHGLHAISVFSDIVALRLMLSVVLATAVGGAGLGALLWKEHLEGQSLGALALMAWGSVLFGVMATLALSGFGLLLTLMSQRNSLDFVPIRDFAYFVEGVDRVGPTTVGG